jgi:hypothetical protein
MALPGSWANRARGLALVATLLEVRSILIEGGFVADSELMEVSRTMFEKSIHALQ